MFQLDENPVGWQPVWLEIRLLITSIHVSRSRLNAIMKRVWLAGFCLLALASGACGRKTARVTQPVSAPTSGAQEGLASWYGKGDGYHGKKTASGERFDRDKLTAAHFSLPFGTMVKVTNKKNGKQVVVKINDRFPIETLEKGRIIDVSYKAAQKLQMVRDGVVPVKLEVVKSH